MPAMAAAITARFFAFSFVFSYHMTFTTRPPSFPLNFAAHTALLLGFCCLLLCAFCSPAKLRIVNCVIDCVWLAISQPTEWQSSQSGHTENGWKVFEAPGVEPVFPKRDHAID